jgi:hypothetical protein
MARTKLLRLRFCTETTRTLYHEARFRFMALYTVCTDCLDEPTLYPVTSPMAGIAQLFAEAAVNVTDSCFWSVRLWAVV